MFKIFNLNTGLDLLVRKRYSCRTFDGKGVEKEKLNILNKRIKEINDYNKDIRFGIVDKRILRSKRFFSQGTYGMFKGDIYYIVGVIKKGSFYIWERFGFYMENLIMVAEDINLNTCWIGGVFDRKGFGSEIDISDDEIVPAIVPIGYAAKHRTIRDKIVRWSAKGDKRKKFGELFFKDSFDKPLIDSQENSLTGVLQNIRLAPSASNKQPWRLIFRDNQIDFFLYRDKFYSKLIPSVDLQKIDMGIAIFHFLYGLKERKITGAFFTEKNIRINNKKFEYIISFIFDD